MSWQFTTIEDSCEILDKFRKPITKKDRVPGNIPYYGATGVVDYVADYIFDEELVLIGEDGAKWAAGDRTAFPISGKTWVNNHAHVLKPNREVLLDKWLIYFFNFSDLSEYITGVTVPKLNQTKLKSIQIPLPPLEEQRRIVALLDQAFEGLDRARANTEANFNSARELFESGLESLLGKTGIENELPLGKLCDFENGDRGKNYPGKKSIVPSGVPFINAGHISDGLVDWNSMDHIPEEKFDLISRGKVRKNDILFCLRGSLGKFGVIDKETKGAIASSLVIIRPGERLNLNFLCHYLRSNKCSEEIENRAGGTAQPNLGAKDLKNFIIPLPSITEQQRVSTILDEAKNRCEMLRTEFDLKVGEISNLRQSLLAKAFAGELT